jgi:hypothetical protein
MSPAIVVRLKPDAPEASLGDRRSTIAATI